MAISAILLETGSCAIILTMGDSQSRDTSRATKKVSLLLDRESQSYLSLFIVSLAMAVTEEE